MSNIIIIGLTPQGLAMLRMLSRAGYDVIAFTKTKKAVGYYSKYGIKKIFDSTFDLKQQIEQIVKNRDTRVRCIITSGELLAMIIEEFPELYELCDVESGPLELIRTLSYKDRMYTFAQSHGLKCAKFKILSEYTSGDLQFPVILKRNFEIPLFFKVKKINNEEELKSFVALISKEDKRYILIQEYIDSKKILNLTYQTYVRNGRCLLTFSGIQKRKLVSGLTSFLIELNSEKLLSQLNNVAKIFFGNTSYTGFSEIEFIYSIEDDQLYFIEINTRVCGTQSALNHKFDNISDIYSDSIQQLKLIEGRKNLTWINITRDIKARMQTKDWNNLSQFFTAKKDIFDWKDIRPFIMQFLK